jgi:hypothetical protein
MSDLPGGVVRRSLLGVAPDVFYEFWMLQAVVGVVYAAPGAAAHLETTAANDEGSAIGIVRNALIESALVHLRNLDDFLGMTSRERRNDDVLAIDFTSDWEPSRILDPLSRQAINKHLQHLTYERVDILATWPLQVWELHARHRFLGFARTVKDEQVRRILLHGPDVVTSASTDSHEKRR